MYARQLAKEDAKGGLINFNTPEEQTDVEQVFSNAISSLSEADRMMPPVAEMIKLLRLGIGVHHSGLLPILKEVVELLFQEQLIKVRPLAKFTSQTFLAASLQRHARDMESKWRRCRYMCLLTWCFHYEHMPFVARTGCRAI
jgi:hypothetical protein